MPVFPSIVLLNCFFVLVQNLEHYLCTNMLAILVVITVLLFYKVQLFRISVCPKPLGNTKTLTNPRVWRQKQHLDLHFFFIFRECHLIRQKNISELSLFSYSTLCCYLESKAPKLKRALSNCWKLFLYSKTFVTQISQVTNRQ